MIEQPRWHLLSEACGKDHINIFFAGAGFEYDLAYDAGVRKRLLSWHANFPDEIADYVNSQSTGRESFGIVDSGAFTVWNKGGSIDIEKYCEKLVELLPNFDVAANLDIIPGKKGMPAKDITPRMTEDAASGGWANYIIITEYLKARGFDWRRIMPIYHQGESMEWLKRMVDYGCPYIGVSPSNDYATPQRQLWLDDVFDYLGSLPTLPKTHGYAVTSPVLMKQYPWFSVDSASWVQLGGYGGVNTPYGVISMSDREEIMGKPKAMDGCDWSPEMKEKMAKYFSDIGINMNDLRSDYKLRWHANAVYILALEKTMMCKPRLKPSSLFL